MTDPTGPAPSFSTFAYEYLEFEAALGIPAIVGQVNNLAADGWRVRDFAFNAGVYRVLMEKETM
jgi:hypothetical protein